MVPSVSWFRTKPARSHTTHRACAFTTLPESSSLPGSTQHVGRRHDSLCWLHSRQGSAFFSDQPTSQQSCSISDSLLSTLLARTDGIIQLVFRSCASVIVNLLLRMCSSSNFGATMPESTILACFFNKKKLLHHASNHVCMLRNSHGRPVIIAKPVD